MIQRVPCRWFLCMLMLALWPMTAFGQSAIGGVVRDTSGAVLPGVTVEATSPALIEKVRATVTNDDGRYSIVDLRPGTYTVTFALAGFNTLVRSGLDLPPSFTATVDAELKVGAIEESITVSGAAPIVDAQSVQRTVSIARDVVDSLPTARNFAATGALAVGVRVNESNVGGARTGSQQRLTVHGSSAVDTRVEIDGINMAAFGTSQNQHNDGMYQEFVVQTGALSADVAGGGVRMTLIPREGGNAFHGAIFGGYTGEGFQASNLTQSLRDRGLSAGNEIRLIYDFNASVGGPIKRDKVWFFGSYRVGGNKMTAVNSFMPDGSPGIFDQFVQNFSARATWQATARNKFSVFQDRARKSIDREIEAGWEPTRASQRRLPTPYYITAVRWTSTISNRLLFQASWGANGLNREYTYQPGVRQERGTAAWYAGASHVDINRGTVTNALNSYEQRTIDSYYGWATSLIYTTGSHNLKVGLEDRYGTYNVAGSMNADLIQRYRDGVPDSVIVYNTPRYEQEGQFKVDMDLGAYVRMPRRTAMTRDRKRFYTVEAGMEKVEILDLASRSTVDQFTLSEGNRKVRIKTLEPDPQHRFVMMVIRPFVRHVDRFEIEPSQLVQYDLATHRITATIPWPNGEERENASMQFSPDGRYLYLFSEQDVLVFDTTTMKQVDKWELSKPVEEGFGAFEFGQIDAANDEPGFYTAMFQVQDPVQKRRLMGIGRIDLAAKKVDFYTLGPATQVGFTMAPGRKKAYGLLNEVGNYEFWTFDLAAKRLASRAPFVGRPRMSLKVSSNGKVLYIYNAGNTIDLYDAETYKHMKTITLDGDITSDLFVIPSPVGGTK